MNWLKQLQWKDTEIVAYQAINNGNGLNNLEKNKQYIFLMGTMLKINVVSGCPLPTDKDHLKILKNEMEKFLMENNSYSTMTSEEIVTAFRFNAAGTLNERIEHWQNTFNLDYLGKVLKQWQIFKRKVQLKADVDQMRINLYEPMIALKQLGNETLEYAKMIWYETKDFLFIPSAAYDYLRETGKLKLSVSRRQQIIESANENLREIVSRYSYDYFFRDLIISDDWEVILSRVSKKIAVSEYFEENEQPFNKVQVHNTPEYKNVND